MAFNLVEEYKKEFEKQLKAEEEKLLSNLDESRITECEEVERCHCCGHKEEYGKYS